MVLHVFPEGWGDPYRMPLAVQRQAAAIEYQFVVGADLVHVDEWRPVPAGVIANQPMAGGLLAGMEWRGRDVDEESSAQGGQLLDGIVGIGALRRPQLRVVPGVFADGNAEYFPLEGRDIEGRRRVEIPGFIEDVVGGQQRFVLLGEDLPLVEQ